MTQRYSARLPWFLRPVPSSQHQFLRDARRASIPSWPCVTSRRLLVTKWGHAKILDFGLAKLESAAEDISVFKLPTVKAQELLTNPGTVMGTMAYMSPEQARGEELDARSDLFSFGAVLYEMASGRMAFSGNTAAVMYDAILNRAPIPVTQLKPEVPPRVEVIISKALEKRPQAPLSECRRHSN